MPVDPGQYGVRLSAAPINGLSVDVEDWYQGFEEIPLSHWSDYPDRLTRSLSRTLDLFAEHQARATFFVLGYNAERYPHLVPMIRRAGHELAVHGYSHRLVYRQTPEEFRSETARAVAVVEDQGGQRVAGYRAAAFSITPRSVWALDVLLELGFGYDSSIFPVRHYRYGWPQAPRHFYRVRRPAGSIAELPLPTVAIGALRLPLAGGAYQRIFPEQYIFAGLRRLNQRGQSFVIYLHPWELDPGQPHGRVKLHTGWSHYTNLRHGKRRFARLLREFRFKPLAALVASADRWPEVTLA